MSNQNDPMFHLAAQAVIRAEGAWAPCAETLRVSFASSPDAYAVTDLHSGRHWFVAEAIRLDLHGVAVGLDLTVQEISGFRA